MSKHYTDDDLRRATEVLMPFYGDGVIASPREHSARFAGAVLDAIAPAIAARVLRDAAEDGHQCYHGTHCSVGEDWLNARADEIELVGS